MVHLFVAEEAPVETGVFSALHSRYFAEYAATLEHSHKTGESEPQLLLALIRTETMVIDLCMDLRIACFLTGLIERIGEVIGSR